jgi:hypothetical protein
LLGGRVGGVLRRCNYSPPRVPLRALDACWAELKQCTIKRVPHFVPVLCRCI